MGLGILEDSALDQVPGTSQYFDDPARPQFASDGVTGLKCDNSGPVPIILVPQPSDDPNDPLNWPLWKRDLITTLLSLTAILATSLGSILAANTVTLSLWFGTDFTQVALLSGYFLMGTGVAATIWVPTSRIWGKRHAFILGALVVVVSSAWSGASDRNYTSMLWARIFQGVGTAPFEALVNAAVGDMYCVHQRGSRMAFTNVAVFGGAFFTPVLVGKITHTLNWWWSFYLVSIFCAACLPLLYFFVPEMAYKRDASLSLDTVAELHRAEPAVPASEKADPEADRQGLVDDSTVTTIAGVRSTPPSTSSSAPLPAKNTWRQNLALFPSRRLSDVNFFKLLLRPFPLLLQPAFLWAVMVQGTMIGWTVFIGVIMGTFFMGYPLWWNEVDAGYAYMGAFLGAIGGFIVAGSLSDSSARLLTRWNGGIYEPEFRLALVIPQLVLGCAGLFGWGITADGVLKGEYSYVVPLTFFGLEVAGMVVGAVASSLYIVDAYRDLVIEGYTTQIIFKNMFSFALTFKAYDWLVENQTRAEPVFNTLGIIQIVVCLTTIPLYIFGKRLRSYAHRHDILAFFKVR